MIEVPVVVVSRLSITKDVDDVRRNPMRMHVCQDGLDFLRKHDSRRGDLNVRMGEVMEEVNQGIDKQQPD